MRSWSYGWRIAMHEMRHAHHGQFIVSMGLEQRWSAQRVWGEHPHAQCEWLGEPWAYESADEAKEACARRIAELDALAQAQAVEAVL